VSRTGPHRLRQVYDGMFFCEIVPTLALPNLRPIRSHCRYRVSSVADLPIKFRVELLRSTYLVDAGDGGVEGRAEGVDTEGEGYRERS
jgi:hypothetical protein